MKLTVSLILISSLYCLTTAAVSTKVKLLVPLYMDPYDEGLTNWQQIGNAVSKINIISIINPENGPGKNIAKDPDYVSALTNLKKQNRQSGGSYMIGYVYTKSGSRAMSAVQADILKYSQWPEQYRPDGIFFDEVSDQKSKVAYYDQIYAYAKSLFGSSSIVITNPGTTFPVEYFCSSGFKNNVCAGNPATDVGVTFESSYNDWLSDHSMEPYTKSLKSTQLAMIVYGCPTSANMRDLINQAVSLNIGYVYVSDQLLSSTSDPYSKLPTYFNDEVNLIASLK